MTMERGTCKHFRGLHHHSTCEAGVNVRQITGGPDAGWGIRVPCRKEVEVRDGRPVERAHCDLYEEPTAEEIAADEAEWEAIAAKSDRQMKAVEPLVLQIKRDNERVSATGVADCPACGGAGKLRWGIVGYNGHVHMRCETEDCISFME
jgi:hypothetical protein